MPNISKPNRMKRQTHKNQSRKKFWCDKCDANLIGWGQKCEVCGFVAHKSYPKKIEKHQHRYIEDEQGETNE